MAWLQPNLSSFTKQSTISTKQNSGRQYCTMLYVTKYSLFIKSVRMSRSPSQRWKLYNFSSLWCVSFVISNFCVVLKVRMSSLFTKGYFTWCDLDDSLVVFMANTRMWGRSQIGLLRVARSVFSAPVWQGSKRERWRAAAHSLWIIDIPSWRTCWRNGRVSPPPVSRLLCTVMGEN